MCSRSTWMSPSRIDTASREPRDRFELYYLPVSFNTSIIILSLLSVSHWISSMEGDYILSSEVFLIVIVFTPPIETPLGSRWLLESRGDFLLWSLCNSPRRLSDHSAHLLSILFCISFPLTTPLRMAHSLICGLVASTLILQATVNHVEYNSSWKLLRRSAESLRL